MKKFGFYLLLLLSTFSANMVHAQWVEMDNIITFDPSDSVLNQNVTIDTVLYPHNCWQVGRPHKTLFSPTTSYPNAIITDTIAPYCPNDTSVFTIHFPWEITNSMGYPDMPFNFSFYYRADTDSSTKILIDFSYDSGSTWFPLIWEAYPYPGVGGWTIGGINLIHISVYNIIHMEDQIRFTFISGSNPMGRAGWEIDDIDIFYSWPEGISELNSNTALKIYPSPAHTSITISAPKTINQIAIKNTLGQCVYKQMCNTNKVEVNLSGLEKGLYFVEAVNSETGLRMEGKVLKE